jgi:steroid 5-alpha reductase family enzyme
MDILYALAISLGINLLLFIPAFIFQTDKLTDLSYGASFVALVWIAFFLDGLFSPFKLLLALMVTLWGLRLAIYLVIRIWHMKKDKRFDGIREHFFRFLGFWLLQAISVWIIMLPTLAFIDGRVATPSHIYLGLVIWALGLIIETIADFQKYRFIKNPKHTGKWIDLGLWRYSRHPNYFGEILVWVGIYLYGLASFQGIEWLYGLASPLFIMILLLFVSGLPQLESYADKKWGTVKGYQQYKKETSILIPWFRSSK